MRASLPELSRGLVAAALAGVLAACASSAAPEDDPDSGLTSRGPDASASSPDARTGGDDVPRPPDADLGQPPAPDAGGDGVCSAPDGGDTEPTAEARPELTDCNDTGYTIASELGGAGDADWFYYAGKDKLGCIVDPAANTSDDVRLCLYAEANGVTVTCRSGQKATSPGGLSGCCNTGKVQLYPESGNGDAATMYLRVDQGATASCTPYSVDLHF